MVSRRNLLLLAAASAVQGQERMPTVRFGNHAVSRLIVGGNPVSGNSHVSRAMDGEMRDYFTSANIKKLLSECEAAGIDTWQSRADRHIIRMLHEYRMEGGRIHWIAQTAPEFADFRRNIADAAAVKPIGIYHHGSSTDKFWNEGKIDEVGERLKIIRQTGAQVGLGTHMPEVVDYVESKGWDIDFYMTCVFRIVDGDNFRDEDREKMLSRVSRVSKPCLIFKVYGATRHCATPEMRRAAIQLAFRYAKPTDALVVGMFPKREEQVRENCRLVREIHGSVTART